MIERKPGFKQSFIGLLSTLFPRVSKFPCSFLCDAVFDADSGINLHIVSLISPTTYVMSSFVVLFHKSLVEGWNASMALLPTALSFPLVCHGLLMLGGWLAPSSCPQIFSFELYIGTSLGDAVWGQSTQLTVTHHSPYRDRYSGSVCSFCGSLTSFADLIFLC